MNTPFKNKKEELPSILIFQDEKAGSMLFRNEPEILSLGKPIIDGKKVTWLELGAAWGLIYVAFLPLMAIIVYVFCHPMDNDRRFVFILLGVYIFSVMATFAIILLRGLRRLDLPNAFLLWMGGATIGQLGLLLIPIIKFMFK